MREQEKERLLSGGIFQSEESRMSSSSVPLPLASGDKRKFDDIGMTHGGSQQQHSDHDIWSEFQSMMMSAGGNRGIVDVMYRSGSPTPR